MPVPIRPSGGSNLPNKPVSHNSPRQPGGVGGASPQQQGVLPGVAGVPVAALPTGSPKPPKGDLFPELVYRTSESDHRRAALVMKHLGWTEITDEVRRSAETQKIMLPSRGAGETLFTNRQRLVASIGAGGHMIRIWDFHTGSRERPTRQVGVSAMLYEIVMNRGNGSTPATLSRLRPS